MLSHRCFLGGGKLTLVQRVFASGGGGGLTTTTTQSSSTSSLAMKSSSTSASFTRSAKTVVRVWNESSAKSSRISRHVVRASSSSSAASAAATSEAEQSTTRDNSGRAIRKRFLNFYENKGHAILPSSSLVPEDPTVLLTIAGMLQFKPIFMGQKEREVKSATTSQKCVRTNDIENVGVTARHHTFF